MGKKQTLEPRLRFPEFREAGEWDKGTFGGVATFYNGRAYKQEELLDVGKYRVLRVGNFFSNTSWYYSDLELDGSKYCEKGDLLYAWSASFGPRIWKGEKVIYHYHIWKVVESEAVDKRFLFFLLDYETERMKSHSANGLGLMHITKGAIESWLCYVPKVEEQQKIADCLSSLDALIAAQADKIDAINTHKKGLMQQIFPREGETVPRLRFPEFRGAGKWVQKPLTKLFDFRDGFAFKSTDFVDSCNEGVIQVVRISDINNQNKNKQKVYVPKSLIDSQGLERYLVDNGDLLLSLTGAAGFNFFFWNGGLSAINQRTCKVVLKNDTHYSLLRLMEPVLYDRLNARGEGQNNNLSKEFLGNTDMLVPRPNEQQKIADCLSSCDALIAAQTDKLEVLKTHKKGLMQQLFPSPGEVVV